MRAFLGLMKYLNKICLILSFFGERKILCNLFLFCCFNSLLTNSVYSETLPQSEINVTGQIRVSKGELIPEGGLNVVLFRLVLNAEGKVTPLGPQGRVKTDNKGNFEFLGVEPDYRSAYQLGTRLDGKLYSTKIFFFKLGEKQIVKDIFIPGITKDIEKLEISQMTLVIESGLSSVTVTEVLSFYNSSPNRIDMRGYALKNTLPKGMYNFSMIQNKSGRSGFWDL